MRSSTARRRLRTAVGMAGLVLPLGWAGGALAATAPAPTVVQGASASLFAAINTARAGAGLAPLSSASDLVAVATEQSLTLATDGYLFHNPYITVEVGHWQALGENVGSGVSAASIATAFMDSTEHRDNILSTVFTQVGVGAVLYKGFIWVTEDFRLPTLAADRVAPANAPTTSGSPVVTAAPAGPPVSAPVASRAPSVSGASVSGTSVSGTSVPAPDGGSLSAPTEAPAAAGSPAPVAPPPLSMLVARHAGPPVAPTAGAGILLAVLVGSLLGRRHRLVQMLEG